MAHPSYYIVFLSLILSCCSNETSRVESSNAANEDLLSSDTTVVDQENTVESDPELKKYSLSEQLFPICQKFYQEMSSPSPIIGANGYYILNLDAHQNRLRKNKLFTENFIKNEKIVFADCAQALEEEKITREMAPDGIDVSAPPACSFFHYNYYLNSQEHPDTFNLLNTKISGNSAITEMHYYIKPKENYLDLDDQIYLRIHLKKIDNKWLIDLIEKITD